MTIPPMHAIEKPYDCKSSIPMAFPIIKAAFLYFISVFATGILWGVVRILLLEPSLGKLGGLLVEAPVMLVAIAFLSHAMCSYCRVPATLKARMRMGMLAFCLLIGTELAGAYVTQGVLPEQYIRKFGSADGVVTLSLFLSFAAMPSLWLAARKKHG